MSRQTCSRHPLVPPLGSHCPACLLEVGLAHQAEPHEALRDVTIQLPLGETDASSVFLVRAESAPQRLFRMKRWHRQAPTGFLDAFHELKTRLDEWHDARLALPVTAWVDTEGGPCVLTEFRQGMPLVEAVRSGRLGADAAIELLGRVRDLLREAHARGLTHGSLVSGNVLATRDGRLGAVLDFGFAPLLSGTIGRQWQQEDLDGLVRLDAALHAST